jgi:hypothetical protein
MKPLSLGDIARLAGCSRARIHQLASKGRLPGEPLKRPPEGQYRFADTPELRKWCEFEGELRAENRAKRPSPRSTLGRTRRAKQAMDDAAVVGGVDTDDLETAKALFISCRRLFAPRSFGEQPMTRGILAVLAHHLVRPHSSRSRSAGKLAEVQKQMFALLFDAWTTPKKSKRPSRQPLKRAG